MFVGRGFSHDITLQIQGSLAAEVAVYGVSTGFRAGEGTR
jgi:hypothetical protein